MYPLDPPTPAPVTAGIPVPVPEPVRAAAEPATPVYAGVAAPTADLASEAGAAPAYVPDSRFVWNGNLPAPADSADSADSAVIPAQETPPTRWMPPPAAPPGWAPPPTTAPGWAAPPPAPGSAPARIGALGSWGAGSTGYTVIAMIALGGLLQILFWYLMHHGNHEVEALVRFEIVAVVAFYAVVGLVVVQRLTSGRVKLFWHDGKPALGVAIGASIGLAFGLLAIGANSAISGHLATDPNAQLMASEGDLPHILALVLITVIAAPLVEETLFRGLFAESLRPKGMAAAVCLSALAFAAWHWRPEALRYYALMGALLAFLYWKRGLVCSMATHACFNGSLAVVAIILALSPGTVVHANGFTFNAPRGWHLDNANTTAAAAHVVGPSAADVYVGSEPVSTTVPSADFLLQRLQASSTSSFLPGVDSAMTNPREIRLPIGTAVEADMVIQGHHGELVLIPTQTEVLVVGFGSGGSTKATADFQSMLQSLRVA
jgi:membrane protease YdiL (CAAX protease family)